MVRALVLDAPGLGLANRPDPAPGAGQVVVRPTHMVIASPDVLAARSRFRGVVGHACVGIVERAGPGEAGLPEPARLVGARVVAHLHRACGECERCRGGLGAHCVRRTTPGLYAEDGVFCERFVAPAHALEVVPSKVTDDAAAMATLVAGAMHAARLVRVELKPYVTVLGDGPIALIAAQVLARANASMRVLGRHAARYALAERWGIKHRDVSEVGLRQDQDVVLDCTGRPGGLELGLRLVRPRGKVVVKAPPVTPAGWTFAADLTHALASEVEVIGAGGGSLREALAALASGEVDVAGLVTRRFKLEQWREAYAAAADRGNVLVVMEA